MNFTHLIKIVTWQRGYGKVAVLLAFLLAGGQTLFAGQQPTASLASPDTQGPAAGPSAPATPLAKLVQEAQQNNPRVIAALRAWQAAEQVPSQVSTLPDPQVTVQQFAVGSPRPFAGFSNSDFAYIGLGISQDLPYPGKLRLQGEAARRQAAASREQMESVRRAVAEQVKTTYYQLSYVQETLEILDHDQQLLKQIEKIAEARYRVGQGNQQDVLKAQLELTKLFRDVTEDRQQLGSLEARLKELLNRPQDSADITAEPLTETSLPFSSDDLLSLVRTGNPDVSAQQEEIRRRSLGVELARKGFYPDFNLQYMWQHTAAPFRDYYIVTLGVKLPIWRSRRQQPEVAEAAAHLNQSRREYEAQVQQAYFDVKDQYLAADADAKVLKIYREGLIPQAAATFRAGLAAYQSGQQDFQTLISSFLDVLNLDTEYWRTLAHHETALARLERVTGVTLP